MIDKKIQALIDSPEAMREALHDYREAVRYLESLSAKFKNQYQRYSVVH